MGNIFTTSKPLKDKSKVSFVINYTIDPEIKKHKLSKNILNKIKSFINLVLSTWGSNYDDSVSYYTTFKTEKINYKNNKINVKGIIKINKKKIKKNNKILTDVEYKNHIDIMLIKASRGSFPIKLNKNHNIDFNSIEKIVVH